MVMPGRFLTGMKEICKYVSRSEATVLNWIRDEEFPAKKLDGIWESHTAKIDAWRMKRWEAA
jgi:predicted DNA-binding transcriptional regulator AlpA